MLKHNIMPHQIEQIMLSQIAKEKKDDLVIDQLNKICAEERNAALSSSEVLANAAHENLPSHDENISKTHSMTEKEVAVCPVCKKIFSLAYRCKTHIRTKHSQENTELLCIGINNERRVIGVCHICPQNVEKRFHDKILLAEHMLKHNITLCDNETTSRFNEAQRNFNLHTTQEDVNVDISEDPTVCKTDDEVISRDKNIPTEDVNKTHSMAIRKVAMCPECNKIFSRLDKCKNHVKKHHFSLQNCQVLCDSIERNRREVGICHICRSNTQKMYPSMALLMVHMLKHDNENLALKITITGKSQTSKRRKISNDENVLNFNTNQDLQNFNFHFLSDLSSQLPSASAALH
jgi:hypothetical protein